MAVDRPVSGFSKVFGPQKIFLKKRTENPPPFGKISERTVEVSCPLNLFKAFTMQKRLTTEEKAIADASTKRLAGYLTAGICGGVLGTSSSDAAIVAIDVSGMSGNNAGLAAGQLQEFINLTGGLRLTAANAHVFYDGAPGQIIATGLGGVLATGTNRSYLGWNSGYANPAAFAYGTTIDSAAPANWMNEVILTGFYVNYLGAPTTSSAFTTTPSYMALRFNAAFDSGNPQYHYGYLEVTWDSANKQFQVLSGAYNDVLDQPILAGATPVPEPSGGALAGGAVAALVMGGAAARRWKKAQRQSSTAA